MDFKGLIPSLLIGVILILGIGTYFQYTKIEDLTKENSRLESEYSYLVDKTNKERETFKSTVDILNSELERFKTDLDKYKLSVKAKTKELAKHRASQEQNIKKELEKDSSDVNQFKIINRILHGFSNKTD